jgi:hypothetical protein
MVSPRDLGAVREWLDEVLDAPVPVNRDLRGIPLHGEQLRLDVASGNRGLRQRMSVINHLTCFA